MRPSWLGDERLRVVQVPAMLKDTDRRLPARLAAVRAGDRGARRALLGRGRVEPPARRGRRSAPVRPGRRAAGRPRRRRLARCSARARAARRARPAVRSGRGTRRRRLGRRRPTASTRCWCTATRCSATTRSSTACRWRRATAAGSPSGSPARTREPGLVVVTGGGGGDGEEVFRLGAALADRDDVGRVMVVAGPYAGSDVIEDLVRSARPNERLRGRLRRAGLRRRCSPGPARSSRWPATTPRSSRSRPASDRCWSRDAARGASRRSAPRGSPRSASPTSSTRGRRSTRWPGCCNATGSSLNGALDRGRHQARRRRPGEPRDLRTRSGRGPMKGPVARMRPYAAPYRRALILGAVLTLGRGRRSAWPSRGRCDGSSTACWRPDPANQPDDPQRLLLLSRRRAGRSGRRRQRRVVLGVSPAQRRRSAGRQRPAGHRARAAPAPVAALPRRASGR